MCLLFEIKITPITVPFRFATIMGVVVSLTSFIYIMYIILKVFLWGEPVQGYPSMMCVFLFLGGVQLLSLGIIGEYLSRVFSESKNRTDLYSTRL